MLLQTNQDGLQIIMDSEGLYFKPYKCPAGYLTIGYGHVILLGENFDDGITKEQALELLKKDIIKAENRVFRTIKPEVLATITINQFSSLVSLAFNLRSFEKCDLIKYINDGIRPGDQEWKDQTWLQYSKAKDPKTERYISLPGLLKRRKKEYELFIKPDDK